MLVGKIVSGHLLNCLLLCYKLVNHFGVTLKVQASVSCKTKYIDRLISQIFG